MDKSGRSRKTIRFPLEVPIVFWWTEDGLEKRSEGRSRDISEKGAFVLASTCPPPGTRLGFNFCLPLIAGLDLQTQVEAFGEVLRVERVLERDASYGFAILTAHKLLRISGAAFESKNRGLMSGD